MENFSLKNKIRETARLLGFDEIGFTRLENFGKGETALQKWVEAGRHGSMKYLEDFQVRKKKFFADFPAAKTVIVLGVNYFSSAKSNDGGLQGRIARYAWGKDYHQVIAEKHRALIQSLAKFLPADFQAKSCVDIQPVNERYAAVRSGLGFIGKNTLLLSRNFGPWLFLSELVTNLDIAEDGIQEDDCGTCDKCQRHCPTGALDEDYNIDARLCIAYLTIEHKGIIPRELRSKIGDRIFGCDECLAVCPFTSKQKETTWQEFRPQAGIGTHVDLDQLFNVASNKEYEKLFSHTAISRANRKQLVRNACIVLGNSQDKRALNYLRKALLDSAPLVRLHSAWAVGELGFREGIELLELAKDAEEDQSVLKEIQDSVEKLRSCLASTKS